MSKNKLNSAGTATSVECKRPFTFTGGTHGFSATHTDTHTLTRPRSGPTLH